jgi:putative ABC transport system ATP-binding protein
VLRVAKAGDHIGEIGPLFGLTRSATARARTDATVTGYSVPAFRHRLSTRTAHRPLEGREPALD